jgi:SAM-dependent methyltransferase
MVERIARTVGTRPEHLVLDLGTGIGGPARRLAAVVGCRVVGIDLVEQVVRVGARRGGRVLYGVADAEALPVATATIDQVWALGVLAHLPDLERALTEAFRVLRSDGALVATEAFHASDEEPAFARSAPRPWHPLAPAETERRLRGVGFGDVRLLDWPGGDGQQPASPADPRLGDDLASGRLRPAMVVATRP